MSSPGQPANLRLVPSDGQTNPGAVMTNKPTIPPLSYDYSGLIAADDAPAIVRDTGLLAADLRWLAPRLAAARQEVLDNLALLARGVPIPKELQPQSVMWPVQSREARQKSATLSSV